MSFLSDVSGTISSAANVFESVQRARAQIIAARNQTRSRGDLFAPLAPTRETRTAQSQTPPGTVRDNNTVFGLRSSTLGLVAGGLLLFVVLRR